VRNNAKLDKKSLLLRIFCIQDGAFKKNLEKEKILKRAIYINDCLTLVNIVSFKNKRHKKEILFLLNDISTNVICSTRLGLYGCVADAASISRTTLEHLAIMDYVIDENKYMTLSEGLKRGYQKVRIDYDSIVKLVDPNINKLHGKLSSLFAHGTKGRVLYSGIHKLGTDCVGASLNHQKIEELLGHLCNLSLFLTRVIYEYLKKNKIENKEYSQNQSKLEEEYKALK